VKSDVRKVISAEWFKAKRQKMTYIMPVLLIGLAALLFFVNELAARRSFLGVPSGFYVGATVISWMSNVMVLLAVVFTSFVVAQEFAVGTVKSTWVRPVRRGNWFTAKYIWSAGAITDIFILLAVVTFGLAFFRLGFTELAEKNYLVHSLQSLSLRLLLTLGLTLFSLWAATAVAATIATLFNNPGGAIAAALGLGIVMFVLSAFGPARPFLLTSYISLPLAQMVEMTKGTPLPLEWNTLIWRTLVGAGAWMVVALFIGHRVIRNKEITA